MRLYPIHIFIKDVSIFIIFFGTTKVDILNNSTVYTGRLSWGEVIISSLYFTIGLGILNTIFQTIIYYGLKSRIKAFLDSWNKFLIGALLHVPTLIIWWNNQDMGDFWTGNILAMTLSTLISGTTYYLLNRGQKDKLKAETI